MGLRGAGSQHGQAPRADCMGGVRGGISAAHRCGLCLQATNSVESLSQTEKIPGDLGGDNQCR